MGDGDQGLGTPDLALAPEICGSELGNDDIDVMPGVVIVVPGSNCPTIRELCRPARSTVEGRQMRERPWGEPEVPMRKSS